MKNNEVVTWTCIIFGVICYACSIIVNQTVESFRWSTILNIAILFFGALWMMGAGYGLTMGDDELVED